MRLPELVPIALYADRWVSARFGGTGGSEGEGTEYAFPVLFPREGRVGGGRGGFDAFIELRAAELSAEESCNRLGFWLRMNCRRAVHVS